MYTESMFLSGRITILVKNMTLMGSFIHEMYCLDYGCTLRAGGIVREYRPQRMETLDYDCRTDEDIVEAVREGDSEALEYLINKYRNFVRAKARSYFLIGADREDIVQEGMIGLYKSIRDFKGDKLASFKAFAELCITRQIITAIKTATRQKHIPLEFLCFFGQAYLR